MKKIKEKLLVILSVAKDPGRIFRWILLPIKRIGIRMTVVGILGLLLAIVGIIYFTTRTKAVSANWWDDTWGYRKAINLTVGSTASDISNLETLLTIDTDDLVTAGKLQSDCDDLRFTSASGNPLPYYLDSGCNGNSTKVWVMADKVPANTTTYTLYMYYGNSTASAGSDGVKFFRQRGLVGYWTMNEGVGTSTPNSSVNTDIANFASGTAAPAWTTGKYSNGLDFDGSADYLTLGDINATEGIGSITISAWIKTDVDFTNRGIIGKWNSGNSYVLRTEASNVLAFNVFTSGNNQATYSVDYSDDAWHHVVGVYDGSNVIVYFDGVAGTPTAATGTIAATTEPVTIGKYSAAQYFDSLIDDVRIYNRALADNEIRDLYNNPGSIASTATATSLPSTSFGSEEVAVGPVAYWKFDEGQGSTVYDSVGSNDGTLGTGTSAPTWVSDDQCVSGKCLRFDGTNDYVDVGTPSSLMFNNQDAFSVFTWIKPNTQTASSGAGKFITQQGTSGKFGYGMSFTTSNTIQISLSESQVASGALFTSSTISLNQWYHVGFSYNGSVMTVYINGKAVGTATWSRGNITDSDNNLYIGSDKDSVSARSFKGFIDEPKIYNYARSAAEIKQDYTSRGSTKGVSAQFGDDDLSRKLSNGLVGYWKMDENTGATTADASGNSNTGNLGTGSSAPTWSSGKFGSGLDFDGSEDYVASNLSLSSYPITLSAWVKGRTTTNNADMFVSLSSSSTQWNYLTLETKYSAGFIAEGQLRTAVGTSNTLQGTTVLNTSDWYHLTAVYESAISRKLYVNGVLEDEESTSMSLFSIDTVTIGGLKNGASALSNLADSTIDDVRIYNRALDPSEVKALYNFAPGPVGHWKMDENTGTSTTYDSSGNGNNGTMNGSMTESDWVPGKFGSALDFDGTDDYVNISDAISVVSSLQSGAVSMWVYRTDASDMDLFGIADAGNSNMFFELHGSYIYHKNGAGLIDYLTFPAIGTDQWHHVTFQSTGTSYEVYIDGVRQTLTVVSGTNSGDWFGDLSSLDNFDIGAIRISSPVNLFNGHIDDVRIYNYARTQKQIIKDMNAGHPSVGSPIGSPVGYWKLDEGYGTVTYNSGNVGSTANGTLGTGSSAPTWTNDGKFGKALSFDGSGDYVSLSNNSALSNDSMTYSVWFKSNSASDPADCQGIIDKDPNTGYSREISLYVCGSSLSAIFGNGVDQTDVVTVQEDLYDGLWHHAVVVKEYASGGDYVRLYADGRLKDEKQLAFNVVQNTTTNFELGRISATSLAARYFSGTIDEVKVYNFALTLDEVKVEYNRGKAIVLGAGSTGVGNTSADSAGREYCPPGETGTCRAPYAEWLLDENTGTTTYDTSANENNGTFIDSPAWAPGINSSGLQFDGANDYVDMGDQSGTILSDPTGSSITWSAWLAPNNITTASSYALTSGGQTSSRGFAMNFNSSEQVFCYFKNATEFANATGTVLPIGAFSHVACVFDKDTHIIQMYINGKLVDSVSSTGDSYTDTYTSFMIGRPTNTSNYYFNGRMDEVRVYDYARTPAQIAWEYSRGAPVAHYKLDECEGTTAYNSVRTYNGSPAGNNGTITIGSGGEDTVGTCTTSSTAWGSGATGKRGASLDFDGTDDYVSVADASTLEPSNTISLSAWVKTSQSGTNFIGIIDKYSGSAAGYMLDLPSGTNMYPRFTIRTDQTPTAGQQVTATIAINNGSWHHIIGIYDTTSCKIYIDGKLNASTSCTGTPVYDSHALIFGGDGVSTNYFNGQIDDVKIFNYALTPAQTKTEYNAGAVRFE